MGAMPNNNNTLEGETMRNLKDYADYCMGMLDAIKIPYTRPEEFTVNTRAVRWGQCKYVRSTGKYYIDINITLLDERNGKDGLINTILHELLHTCPNCMNHGSEWKKWAEKVKRYYGYDIKRLSDSDEKDIVTGNLNEKKTEYKYLIYCRKCGKLVTKRKKQCNITEYPELWIHGSECRGKLYCVESGKIDRVANN